MSDSPASAYTADLRSRPTTPLLDRRAAKVAAVAAAPVDQAEDELCIWLGEKAGLHSAVIQKSIDKLHGADVHDVAALQVLQRVGGLRDVLSLVAAQQIDDALAALSLQDPAPAFSARVCAAAGASAPALLDADRGGVDPSGVPPSGVPTPLSQWTLPHPVQSMRGGSEYKHGFGVDHGGANFSGELSKSKWELPSSARGDASTSSARADGAPAMLTEAVMGPTSPKGHRVSSTTTKPSYDVTEVIDQPPPTARRLPQPDPSAATPVSPVSTPLGAAASVNAAPAVADVHAMSGGNVTAWLARGAASAGHPPFRLGKSAPDGHIPVQFRMKRHHWEALHLYDGWLRGDVLRPVDASKGWDEAEEFDVQHDEFGAGNKNPSKSDIVRVAQLLQLAIDGLCHADPGEFADGGKYAEWRGFVFALGCSSGWDDWYDVVKGDAVLCSALLPTAEQLLRILMQGQKEAWGAEKASMAGKKKYAFTAKDYWAGVDGWRVPRGVDPSDPDASRAYFDQLKVSRIDFDEFYDPAEFADRAYGDIGGSAADGEGL